MNDGEIGGDSGNGWLIPNPNFVTEVMFMAHILINIVSTKLEKQYE